MQNQDFYTELKELQTELDQVCTDHLPNMEAAWLNKAKNRVSKWLSYTHFIFDSQYREDMKFKSSRFDGAEGPDVD